MPGRHRRDQGGHRDVDAEEPQGLAEQETDDVDAVLAHAQCGCRRQGEVPGQHEDERRSEQADQTAVQVLRVAGPATTQASPDGDVGEAPCDEEQWHHLQQPGGQLQRRDRGQRVRAGQVAVLDDHGRHQPVAEHHDEQAAGPDGVDETIPPGRGGRADSVGKGGRLAKGAG
ncbi:MAG: hypothetical protein H7270_07320 [Dermatophilaceae bacterium]|nr:hypothetical protein [Dermatophilaceae bacterium]